MVQGLEESQFIIIGVFRCTPVEGSFTRHGNGAGAVHGKNAVHGTPKNGYRTQWARHTVDGAVPSMATVPAPSRVNGLIGSNVTHFHGNFEQSA